MTTPRTLITQSLKNSGVNGIGQLPAAEDLSDALFALQGLAAQWARKQYLPPGVVVSLDADMGLTPDFDMALMYNLGVRLRPAYQLPADPELAALAEDALATIRKSNVQAASAGTPRDLISLALKVSGAIHTGQVAPVADVADAYTLLQQIGAQWARKRWLVFHLADTVFSLTGAPTYSIGLGGDVPVVRPDRIEAAFARWTPSQPYPMDYPLRIIDSREEWNRIWSKSLSGPPGALFYDPGWPLGSIAVWPNPISGQAYDIHLAVKGALDVFPGMDTVINLPPEYAAALLYNLAARLRPAYGMAPDPTVTGLALDALNTIRRTNTQLPPLQMPARLPGTHRRGGDWMYGLGGGGGAPGFTQQGFRIGISSLNGSDIVE